MNVERPLMTALTQPDIATRIATLAQQLGFDGSDAAEQVLDLALEYLEDSTAQPAPLYTRGRRDAAAQRGAAAMAQDCCPNCAEPGPNGGILYHNGAAR